MATIAVGFAASQLTADVNPKSIPLGQAAQLSIKITGDVNAKISVPQIEGVTMQQRGSSSHYSVVHGRVTQSVTYMLLVQPHKTGTFTLGPITAETVDGKLTTGKNLKLKVTKGMAPKQPAQANPAAPGGNARAKNAKATLKDFAFLEVVGLKKKALVGETLPVEIRAFVKSPIRLVSLQSHPTIAGGSFTLKLQDGEPQQGTVTYKGEQYYVVIYKGAITPIKPGEYKLPFTLESTLLIPQQRKRRRNRDPFFNDPFFDDVFDDFFNRGGVEKEVTLSSEPFTMKVESPPAEGRPATFDGAIGQFSIEASASPTLARSGDPIKLIVRVTGNGNLTRLRMPPMEDPTGWKIYPAKDHLEGANDIATSGTKVFEQVIIPRNASVKEIPPLVLSFYDPESKTYRTIKTQPIPVTVTPGTDIVDDEDGNGSAEANTDKKPTVKVPHSSLGWLRKSRIDQAAWLYPVTGGAVVALLGLAAGIGLWRKQRSPERLAAVAQKDQVNKHLSNAESAAKNGDASAFFAHAKKAIQLYWANQLGLEPSAVTAADIKVPEARAIIEKADSIEFSPNGSDESELQQWLKKLRHSLSNNTTQKKG